MITVDKTMALVLVRKHAEQEPEKNVNCEYTNALRVEDGEPIEPVCIVGCILVNDLGYPVEFFNEDNHVGRFTKYEGVSFPFNRGDEVRFTDEAIDILDAAQSVQDGRLRNACKIVTFDYDTMESEVEPEFFKATWGDAGRFVEKYFA